MLIEVVNLSHTYMPGTPFQSTAIHDISFSLRSGEFVGIIGHTGSGKSTLIQHLNALLVPSQGKVFIEGIDLHETTTSKKSIRQKIGLVFQYPEHQLFEETIEKDVAFGPQNLGLSKEDIQKRVERALSHVGLDYDIYAQRSPFELSGGEMRRAAIAGVLAMEPKILVLDEPAAGLDPQGRDEILALIKSFHEKNNLTVIMISHSMDDIALLANRLLVLNKGRLVADDSPSKIFSDIDFMKNVGLDIPQTTQLLNCLHDKGWNINTDQYSLENAADRIAQYILNRKAHKHV